MSGDYNLLHAHPEFAQKLDFKVPILHIFLTITGLYRATKFICFEIVSVFVDAGLLTILNTNP